jgi:hypothetical protein
MMRSPSSIVLTLLFIGASFGCATERTAIKSAATPTAPPNYDAAVDPGLEPETAAPELALEVARTPEAVPASSSANLALFEKSLAPAQGGRPMGVDHQHFMLLLGERALEDPLWKNNNLDKHFSTGFTFDKQENGAPVAIDFGLYYTDDSTTTFTGGAVTDIWTDILEFNIGALKLFNDKPGGLQPYLGGGLALAWASAVVWRFNIVDDIDFTPGYYLRGGMALQAKSGGMIGIDFHYLGATSVNLGGFKADIDGMTISLVLGMGF